MTDVQGAGRVGRDKFEQNPRVFSGWLAAVRLRLLENRREFGVIGIGAEVKIDEAWPGDFDLVEIAAFAKLIDNFGRDITWTFSRGLRQPHRNVACEVAMTRIARAFERAFDREVASDLGKFGQSIQGILENVGNNRFHNRVARKGGLLRARNSTRTVPRDRRRSTSAPCAQQDRSRVSAAGRPVAGAAAGGPSSAEEAVRDTVPRDAPSAHRPARALATDRFAGSRHAVAQCRAMHERHSFCARRSESMRGA